MTETAFDHTNLSALGESVTYQSMCEVVAEYFNVTSAHSHPLNHALLQDLKHTYNMKLPAKPRTVSRGSWDSRFEDLFQRVMHVKGGLSDGKAFNEKIQGEGSLYALRDDIFRDAIEKDIARSIEEQNKSASPEPRAHSLYGAVVQARNNEKKQLQEYSTSFGNALSKLAEKLIAKTVTTDAPTIDWESFVDMADQSIEECASRGDFDNKARARFYTLLEELYASAKKPQLTVVPSDLPPERVTANQVGLT